MQIDLKEIGSFSQVEQSLILSKLQEKFGLDFRFVTKEIVKVSQTVDEKAVKEFVASLSPQMSTSKVEFPPVLSEMLSNPGWQQVLNGLAVMAMEHSNRIDTEGKNLEKQSLESARLADESKECGKKVAVLYTRTGENEKSVASLLSSISVLTQKNAALESRIAVVEANTAMLSFFRESLQKAVLDKKG